jgi:GNAT superfamily N-acetyltransferase
MTAPITIRELTSDDLPTALSVGGPADPAESRQMFARHPDLFLGCFEAGRMVGVCYGWPVTHERAGAPMMRLELIAVVPDARGRGLGRALLAAWERRVARRGAWTIDVGSAADGFFLRCGYVPVEYCLKGREASGGADDLLARYVPITGGYSPRTKAKLQRELHARQAITIFRKRTS